ncbi:LysR family transcriptional regulator [Streptantibioticus silvisoli]|uniref:LysR family transcriptional regulator n=1 Tax=Streptantibioticus silvisoli TaxID=2705255 RepID=A0ABT6W4H0_9ACTN|nr:LysR family transcriptional regulator [Streptantibioticus silvisoli]MDI5965651.1 LysR family transcriptional regulator [Streptantibioticus silvisoli]
MEWSDDRRQLMSLCPDLVRFAAVARLEHLSGAADELGVPQSTVSRSVARLERAVGCPLFDREGRGLRLTRQGRVFLGRVRTALDEIAVGADELRRATDRPGEIALGFLPALGTAPVPQLVSWFRARRPGVRFRLVQSNAEGLLARLRSGEVDLCLTSPLPDEPDVTATPVAREPLRLVVPAGHRLAGRGAVRLADAAGEDFVMATAGYGLRRLVDDLCAAAGFTPRVAFEGAEISTIRGFVAAGLGVAVLPPPSVATPGLVDLPLTEPTAHRTVGLTHVTARHRTPVTADFAAMVLTRAQECFGGAEGDAGGADAGVAGAGVVGAEGGGG